MSLSDWLALFKVETLIRTINISGWFRGWFVSRDEKKIETQNYIEKAVVYLPPQSLPATEDQFTKGLLSLGLTEEQLNYYGVFFNSFYRKLEEKRKQQITRNALTMMQGAVFSLGTRPTNPEWKEHCASSLREIFHEWDGLGQFRSDLVKIFEIRNGTLGSVEVENLRSFWLLYNYFSSLDHHEVSGVIHSLRALLKDNSLKPEDCYKEDIFIERVKQYFLIISWITEFSEKSKNDHHGSN